MKIGIMGGSFDPVHYGHICLAKQALNDVDLDKVIFMPTKLQPFKLDKRPASGQDRLNMLSLAIENMEKTEISTYELSRKAISYTINTLKAVKKKYDKDTEIYFILGADSFLKIRMWKDSNELLRDYSFIVGARPAYDDKSLQKCIEEIRVVYNTKVVKVDNQQINISATDIRTLFKTGKSFEDNPYIDQAIPNKVKEYIIKHGIYN